jgi:predicted PurR-regulated permease PerM
LTPPLGLSPVHCDAGGPAGADSPAACIQPSHGETLKDVLLRPESAYSSRVAWVFLAILLAGAAFLAFRIVRPFAAPVLTGVVAAVIFYPVHQWIARVIRWPSLASAVSTLLMLLVFLGPLTALVVMVSREVRDVLQSLGPNAVDEGPKRLWGMIEGPLNAILSRLGLDVAEVRDAVVARLGQISGTLLRQTFTAIGAATGGVAFVVIAAIAFFFSLRDGAAFYGWALLWSPLGEKHTRMLLDAVQGMIVASFYGVISVALAQGFLCGLGAWIVGLPSPVLWGTGAAGASVIPFVGSALAWVPAAVVLFVQGSIGKGIFMLAWGVGIVGTIDNLVRPLVVTAKMPLNMFLVLVAMLGGIRAFGVTGILIGPVTLTVILILLRIVREKMQAEPTREVPEAAGDG